MKIPPTIKFQRVNYLLPVFRVFVSISHSLLFSPEALSALLSSWRPIAVFFRRCLLYCYKRVRLHHRCRFRLCACTLGINWKHVKRYKFMLKLWWELVDSPRSAVARHATTLAVVFATKLPAAAAPSQVVRTHLSLSCSVIAAHVHLQIRWRTLSILICIPGCFKLNYFHIICSRNSNRNTQNR